MGEEFFQGRKEINLFEYSPEIMYFFKSNKYKLTKEGLRTAINDWLDGEYYKIPDQNQKTEFIEKYSKEFNI